MSAGRIVREARKRHGLDQRALARRARTSQTQISRIERGAVSPSVQTVARLLEVMGERLELTAAAGPRGNQPTRQLRTDFERLTPGERIAEAAELSRVLTTVAHGARR